MEDLIYRVVFVGGELQVITVSKYSLVGRVYWVANGNEPHGFQDPREAAFDAIWIMNRSRIAEFVGPGDMTSKEKADSLRERCANRLESLGHAISASVVRSVE